MIIKLPLDNWKSGKNHSLNMNNYRNWHYRTSNAIKKKVVEYLQGVPIKPISKARIGYTLYFKDKRVKDLMNFIAVADKFLLDALISLKILKDDNYKVIDGYDYINYKLGSDINYIEMEIIEID